MFKYCFKNNFPELRGETRELSKIFFDKIPVIKVNEETSKLLKNKIIEIQELKLKNFNTRGKESEIDEMIFDLYHLSIEERETIGFIEIQ